MLFPDLILIFYFQCKLFLGEFAKFWKANISFVMSVHLSVCPTAWNNSAPTGQISFTFVTICRWILPRMRNISNKVVEKIKIHILCRVTFFRKGRIRVALWIMKATRVQTHANGLAPTQTCTLSFTHACARTHAHNMQGLLVFYGSNGFVNAPHCYVLPVLLCVADVIVVIVSVSLFLVSFCMFYFTQQLLFFVCFMCCSCYWPLAVDFTLQQTKS
jgi:hypothetical protein